MDIERTRFTGRPYAGCVAQDGSRRTDEAEKGKCKGSPAGRAEAHLTKDQSAVWRRYMITTSSLRSMGARHVRPHTIPSKLAEGWEEDGEGELESGTGRGGETEKVPAYSAMGHRLASAGPLLWCVKCVSFAHSKKNAKGTLTWGQGGRGGKDSPKVDTP